MQSSSQCKELYSSVIESLNSDQCIMLYCLDVVHPVAIAHVFSCVVSAYGVGWS